MSDESQRELSPILGQTSKDNKQQIKTLGDVFLQFKEKMDIQSDKNVFSQFSEEHGYMRKLIHFLYDNKVWAATVTKEQVQSHNPPTRPTRLINYKLPLDEYVFSFNSEASLEGDWLKMNRDDVKQFVRSLRSVVPHELNYLDAYYKPGTKRVEFYFYDKTEERCVTIKFEYGTYETYERKRRFNLNTFNFE